MGHIEQIGENLSKGQAAKVRELTEVALNEGISVREILYEGLISAMSVVGEKFQKKEIYVPEVLLAARAMRAGMDLLEPLLIGSGVEPIGKVVLGTVKGDVHDIGKNLVGLMLKGAGFEVNDLGIDIPPQKFIDAARENRATLICMSCLLTTSLPFVMTTIEALEASGVKSQIKTMVGGAAVTQRYADEIGADGYAPDAGAAVDKAKELLGYL